MAIGPAEHLSGASRTSEAKAEMMIGGKNTAGTEGGTIGLYLSPNPEYTANHIKIALRPIVPVSDLTEHRNP
jgi:hypothetical protein